MSLTLRFQGRDYVLPCQLQELMKRSSSSLLYTLPLWSFQRCWASYQIEVSMQLPHDGFRTLKCHYKWLPMHVAIRLKMDCCIPNAHNREWLPKWWDLKGQMSQVKRFSSTHKLLQNSKLISKHQFHEFCYGIVHLNIHSGLLSWSSCMCMDQS